VSEPTVITLVCACCGDVLECERPAHDPEVHTSEYDRHRVMSMTTVERYHCSKCGAQVTCRETQEYDWLLPELKEPHE
jgi:hypothetical protein